MDNVLVGRYSQLKKVGWQGWIEDQKKTWICFIKLDGSPVFYLNRDKKTGAVK